MRSELLWENKCFVLSVPLVFSPDLALSEKSDNSVGKKHEVFVLLPKMRNRPEGTDALLNCYLEGKKLLICEGNFVSICFQTENQKFSVVLAHLSTGSSLSSIPRFFVHPPLHWLWGWLAINKKRNREICQNLDLKFSRWLPSQLPNNQLSYFRHDIQWNEQFSFPWHFSPEAKKPISVYRRLIFLVQNWWVSSYQFW